MSGNKKLFWKEVRKVNGRKDGNGRLMVGEEEVGRTWNDYFEDLHNMDAEEQVIVHLYVFSGI